MSYLFDAALGITNSALNSAVTQLYANSDARQKLFQGSKQGTLSGLSYTLTWNMQTAPAFSFAPIDATQWTQSVNSQGANPAPPAPTTNVLQLSCSQFNITATVGSAPQVSGTGEVIVFAQAAVNGSTLTISPLSIWVDESKMDSLTKGIVAIAIMDVLAKMTTLLASIAIPPLSFTVPETSTQISLTPPVISINSSTNTLIVAACLQGSGPVDLTGFTFPTQNLFLLVSQALITQLFTDVATAKIVGVEKKGSGSEKSCDYNYDAKILSVTNIGPASATDLTTYQATVNYTLTASVSVAGGLCGVSAATNSM